MNSTLRMTQEQRKRRFLKALGNTALSYQMRHNKSMNSLSDVHEPLKRELHESYLRRLVTLGNSAMSEASRLEAQTRPETSEQKMNVLLDDTSITSESDRWAKAKSILFSVRDIDERIQLRSEFFERLKALRDKAVQRESSETPTFKSV